MAVVLETSDQSARIGFPAGPRTRWRRESRIDRPASSRLKVSNGRNPWRVRRTAGRRPRYRRCCRQVDVIYADPLFRDGNPVEGQYRLRQLPEVSGAMVVMDPWTGRVLAMVGGFLVRPEPVQPRYAGLSAAGLVVQADRLFGGARQTAIRRRPRWSTRRSKSIRGRGRHLASGEFRPANTRDRRRCRCSVVGVAQR